MSTLSHVWRTLTLITALVVLAACGNIPPEERPVPTELEIAKLAEGILALGPNVDPDEALRAARISFEHTRELAIQYEIVDPPLVHNTKVNMGLKPRGLCWHWAEDMEKRLKAENFETLVIHRAIANANNYRIEHSTAIISQRGDDMYKGMVVDPWRTGGTLTFNLTALDPDYDWLPQDVVHEQKRQEIRAEQRRAVLGI
ncbi:MAG: hypothetical protein HKN27_14665 [Silicimonas sp.]|nr:hypothetical protein [Silicimonas sp.]